MMVIKKIYALLIVISFIFSGEVFAKRTSNPEVESTRIARKAQLQKARQKRREDRANRRKAQLQKRREARANRKKAQLQKSREARTNRRKASPASKRARNVSKPQPQPVSKRAARSVKKPESQPKQVSKSRATPNKKVAPRVYTLKPTDLPPEVRASAIQLAREEGIPETREGGLVVTHNQLKSALNTLAAKEKKHPTLIPPGTTQRFRQFLVNRYGYQG
ncbi:MAG: hypothetical protein JSR85_00815 [Proteobacteria bacterium]|nr:hypothetical protein [Pseudomonadota bacterium]